MEHTEHNTEHKEKIVNEYSKPEHIKPQVHVHQGHTPKHHTSHREKTNTKFMLMAILLGLLIIVAGFQAVELVGLKNKLGSELSTLSVSGGKSSSSPSVSSSDSLKKNLENLPTMVGGC